MFALEVRDHIMIAHSFSGELFGPAQAMHGATFVVDACLFADALDNNAVLVDIGAFAEALKAVLSPLNYQNLDEMPEFAGQNTTTEFLAQYIHTQLADKARAGVLGRPGAELSRLRVTLSESHVAKAWYEADI
ncbi:MAG: 6-carboxytetrahydropterin synthase [Pseudomonadota bacterium]